VSESGGFEGAPLSPDYGKGCYRRAILLRNAAPTRVEAALEDDPHAFALTLGHDGERVTSLSASAHRYPLTTCSGATGALQSVVGAPLRDALLGLKRHADPRSNCTHLFDLAALAIEHVFRAERERLYRIEIPDAIDGRTEARLDRDHGRVLTWSVRHGVITAPERFAGQRVLGGFTRWATAELAGEELEFALVLARGYFVALSRLYDMDAASLGPASDDPMPSGVCYSYSPGQAEHAYRVVGSRRDFTDSPEQLLHWHTAR
jgi:hypothetical protein